MRSEIESISAITLVTNDMSRSVEFYQKLGFDLAQGGAEATFSTFRTGSQYLNLSVENSGKVSPWGRVIFYVNDVDAFYQHCLDYGIAAEFAPRDAPWGERYFHVMDPDGHELSFAKRISS